MTTHIAPGVVIIENALPVHEQMELIDLVQKFGRLKTADNKWNFFGQRGRTFNRLDRYFVEDRRFLEEVVALFRDIAELEDTSLVYPPSTHLLTLWYSGKRGLGWHRDDNDQTKGGNNGDDGAPVYSLSLGNSCAFEFILEGDPTETVREVILRSGTIIVFGGPQRLMKHRVREVFPGTFVGIDGRINLTFRTCTDFSSEDEAKYQTEAYVKRLQEGRK